MQLFKKYWLGLFGAALVVLAAFMIYEKLHPKKLPPNLIQGVGHIDGDLTTLNVKYPGRVVKIFVGEGDRVKRGEKLAQLDSDELRARLSRIAAEESAKRDELASKRVELEISKKRLPLLLEKSSAGLRAAESRKAQLKAEISSMREVVEQDDRDYARAENLYAKRLIQKELLEKSALKLKTDSQRLQGLIHKEIEVEAAISVAKADMREAEAVQKRIAALQKGIAALKEGVKAAAAAKKEVEAMMKEMTLASPVDGYVVEKIANEGEVVGSGMAVLTLIDPDSLYLKIFVDTIENGKIKIGDRAVIFLDSYPDRPIEAKVVRIAQRAEFTPKEVNVRSDRIQRVFALHIKPLKADPLLKLGIPATGVVALGNGTLPKSLNDLPQL
ncbi:HlyD family secretion protein [Hydrogenimonas sp.]|nr:HlyD family secretion protein [Hydrogenimonas sp.]